MSIEPVELSFTQGETSSILIELRNEDDTASDISTDTFEAQIRDVDDLTTLVASFEVSKDVPAGNVLLNLDRTTTMGIPPTVLFSNKGVELATPDRVLFYDCFRIKQDGVGRLVAKGPVKVYPAMTR